jgi:hypothetical protein
MGAVSVEQPEVTSDELKRVSAYLLYWAKKDAVAIRNAGDQEPPARNEEAVLMSAKVLVSVWLGTQAGLMEVPDDEKS